MSQRLGMADGRCFSLHTSSLLLNDHIMKTNGIEYQNNYAYRHLLQQMGPRVISNIEAIQSSNQVRANNINFVNQCQSCNVPLLKVPNTY